MERGRNRRLEVNIRPFAEFLDDIQELRYRERAVAVGQVLVGESHEGNRTGLGVEREMAAVEMAADGLCVKAEVEKRRAVAVYFHPIVGYEMRDELPPVWG